MKTDCSGRHLCTLQSVHSNMTIIVVTRYHVQLFSTSKPACFNQPKINTAYKILIWYKCCKNQRSLFRAVDHDSHSTSSSKNVKKYIRDYFEFSGLATFVQTVSENLKRILWRRKSESNKQLISMFSRVKTIIHLMACYETDTLLIVTCESSWFEHPVVVSISFRKT